MRVLGRGSDSGNSLWTGWAAALGVALLPAVLATLPPFLGPAGRAVVMAGFAPFCHQLPAYSPHLDGVQLAVGHRDYGIFWGVAFAALAFPVLYRRFDGVLNRRVGLVVGLAALPAGLDWILDAAGWWDKTPASRFGTGLLFGIVAGYFLARAVVNLVAGRLLE